MLTIYRNGIDKIPAGIEVVRDIEDAFKQIIVSDTKFNRTIIENNELGEYGSRVYFIDRFGFKVPIMCLSTGSKTAIVTNELSNCIIDTAECGKNAIEIIVSFCNKGNIILSDFQDIDDFGNMVEDIDIKVGSSHFNSMYDLNKAIEWGDGWNEL